MKNFYIAIVLFLIFPVFVFAQGQNSQDVNSVESGTVQESVFKARVVEVIEEKQTTREDGTKLVQQKLKLVGLGKEREGEEIIYDGFLWDIESVSKFEVGDKVLVSENLTADGEVFYFINDYVRSSSLWILALVFAAVVVVVGKWKGFRALIVLALTFVIILKFLIPQIMAGQNALLITIISSLAILVMAIYLTEGIKKTSTISVVSIIISLTITGIFSIWFTAFTKLSGFYSEEASFLTAVSGINIDIRGLLLAGIIIGTLGVLDDVVISQVSLVKELKEANPNLSKKEVYKKAMKVGISHLSSMVNTLFLAYAGAALPLLILFNIKQPPFLNFTQVINNEIIATEIVRSLTGSIGLVLAIPIATFLAINFISSKKIKV